MIEYQEYKDYCNVKLECYSQRPPGYVDEDNGLFDSGDEDMYSPSKQELTNLVAYCARVSNPGNMHNKKTAPNLVKYLVNHRHWSPLEMVSMTLRVDTTRDIGRQGLRHASMRFQEFSQRYADPTKELSFVTREARLQDPKNRQNSIDVDFDDPVQRELNEWFRMEQVAHIRDSVKRYEAAIAKGIAKEQARCYLPEGNTGSRLFYAGTLRSWCHYIDTRSGGGTQKEHIQIAVAAAQVISEYFAPILEFVRDE